MLTGSAFLWRRWLALLIGAAAGALFLFHLVAGCQLRGDGKIRPGTLSDHREKIETLNVMIAEQDAHRSVR